jgi:predicted phosphodiesterase
MKYAVLSDIHGNIDGLVAALKKIKPEKPDRIIILGDIVLAGPDPVEVIEEIGSLNDVICIAGNADRWILDGFGTKGTAALEASREWTLNNLHSCHIDFLKNLAFGHEEHVNKNVSFLCVHASPASDEKGFNQNQTQTEQNELLNRYNGSFLTAGHTHLYFHTTLENTEIYTIPGISLPRSGKKSAQFAILKVSRYDWELTIQEAEYDFKKFIHRLNQKNHPTADKISRCFV